VCKYILKTLNKQKTSSSLLLHHPNLIYNIYVHICTVRSKDIPEPSYKNNINTSSTKSFLKFSPWVWRKKINDLSSLNMKMHPTTLLLFKLISQNNSAIKLLICCQFRWNIQNIPIILLSNCELSVHKSAIKLLFRKLLLFRYHSLCHDYYSTI